MPPLAPVIATSIFNILWNRPRRVPLQYGGNSHGGQVKLKAGIAFKRQRRGMFIETNNKPTKPHRGGMYLLSWGSRVWDHMRRFVKQDKRIIKAN